MFQHTAARRRLVTAVRILIKAAVFQHTAARRRLVTHGIPDLVIPTVSTHSRPKAAGIVNYHCLRNPSVSTHSRPKAAGSFLPL